MPSTVVHVGLAGLLGIALLGDRFDTKAILVVLAATAALDLDTLIGMVWDGTHRAALHNIFVVLVPGAALYWDTRLRSESIVRTRLGPGGPRTLWATLGCLLFAHVLLDAFFNGVNLLWPLHDQFYDLSGKLYLSNHDGFVQTFVEFSTSEEGTRTVSESTTVGTTEDTHYRTGFDPGPQPEPEPERIFPIAYNGERFVVALAGYLAVGVRIFEDVRTGDTER
ncbi:metal-dependent hydrolase [Halovivax cerinus]|uniref:Metal-dependent hydrolase n=1 Tax=Halovivax cerinus TaxID=1487865 RepID=A0ABD5NN35_9EURY|nr:metal-dependent hydrolase [Halovivax cerinus]